MSIQPVGTNLNCCICLDKIAEQRTFACLCKEQNFHAACMIGWINSDRNFCPTCKAEITPIAADEGSASKSDAVAFETLYEGRPAHEIVSVLHRIVPDAGQKDPLAGIFKEARSLKSGPIYKGLVALIQNLSKDSWKSYLQTLATETNEQVVVIVLASFAHTRPLENSPEDLPQRLKRAKEVISSSYWASFDWYELPNQTQDPSVVERSQNSLINMFGKIVSNVTFYNQTIDLFEEDFQNKIKISLLSFITSPAWDHIHHVANLNIETRYLLLQMLRKRSEEEIEDFFIKIQKIPKKQIEAFLNDISLEPSSCEEPYQMEFLTTFPEVFEYIAHSKTPSLREAVAFTLSRKLNTEPPTINFTTPPENWSNLFPLATALALLEPSISKEAIEIFTQESFALNDTLKLRILKQKTNLMLFIRIILAMNQNQREIFCTQLVVWEETHPEYSDIFFKLAREDISLVLSFKKHISLLAKIIAMPEKLQKIALKDFSKTQEDTKTDLDLYPLHRLYIITHCQEKYPIVNSVKESDFFDFINPFVVKLILTNELEDFNEVDWFWPAKDHYWDILLHDIDLMKVIIRNIHNLALPIFFKKDESAEIIKSMTPKTLSCLLKFLQEEGQKAKREFEQTKAKYRAEIERIRRNGPDSLENEDKIDLLKSMIDQAETTYKNTTSHILTNLYQHHFKRNNPLYWMVIVLEKWKIGDSTLETLSQREKTSLSENLATLSEEELITLFNSLKPLEPQAYTKVIRNMSRMDMKTFSERIRMSNQTGTKRKTPET